MIWFLTQDELKVFLNIQKKWHIFLKEELLNIITEKELNTFLERWVIKDLFKNKIFWLVSRNKTENDLFQFYHKKILSLVWQVKLKWEYCMWYKYSLFLYLNKIKVLDIKDISYLVPKKKISVELKWIWTINWKFESIEWKSIEYWQEKLKIVNHLHLFLYLFWKAIYWKWLFDTNDLVLFLKIFYVNKDELIQYIDSNEKKFKHIITNSFEIYKLHNITNNTLFDIYKHYWLLKDEDKQKNHYWYTYKDYWWESWDIVRHKQMIDEIINFTVEFEQKWKHIVESLKKYTLDEIKEEIKKDKANDIYHSTTIEWYKINKDDVLYINDWILPEYIDKSQVQEYEKKISDVWIIRSYKRTLEMIIDEYLWKNKQLTKDDLVKINFYEFIEFHEQRWEFLVDHNYRNHIVRMNWTEWYLPVETISKIDILVDYLFENLNKIQNHLLRWIVLHFLMIPIQPFSDWNWRLSRFLMNIEFSNWWYKWCTIDKHDYRLEFLSSYWYINEDDYESLKKVYIRFISFIIWYFKINK